MCIKGSLKIAPEQVHACWSIFATVFSSWGAPRCNHNRTIHDAPLRCCALVGCLRLCAFAFSPLRFGGCLCLCAFALWRVPFALAPWRVCVCVLGRLPLRLWLLPLPLRLCAFALWWVVSAFAPLRVLLLCLWAVACAFALWWCAFACCVFSCLPWFAWGVVFAPVPLGAVSRPSVALAVCLYVH